MPACAIALDESQQRDYVDRCRARARATCHCCAGKRSVGAHRPCCSRTTPLLARERHLLAPLRLSRDRPDREETHVDFGVMMFPTEYSVGPDQLAVMIEQRGYESL